MARTTKLLAAVAALGLFLAGGSAWAAIATGTADVNILTALSLSNTQGMSFGDILPPSSGTQTFDLAAATGAVTAGTGDGAASGSPQAAVFAIAGEASRSITTSTAIDGNFGDGNLVLSALTTSGATTAIPGTGSGTINVGATLGVTNGVAGGTHSATISVTVAYQ